MTWKTTCSFDLKRMFGGPGCQFPEEELVQLPNGQTWCRFHLPMRADKEETAKARWDEAEIEEFNSAIFAFIDNAMAERRLADLSGVVFPGMISFERYRGPNSLPHVSFIRASFRGNALFQGADFNGPAGFKGASFGGDAEFMRASFGDVAWFDEASFDGDARFDLASFGRNAEFMGANFRGDAWFGGASFGGDAWFRGASFGGFAWFEGASFGGNTWFGGASFGRDALFRSTKPAAGTFQDVEFVGVKFSGDVRFHNRKFLGTTDFRGTHFERAPKFHGCILHQDTFFPSEANFRDRSGAEAALAYRTLKHAMASVHARGEEAKFYVLEQKSLLRDKDTRWWSKIPSVLYWLAANYGQGLLRPFVWILITFAAFFAIYAAFLLIYLEPTSRFVFPAIDVWDLLRFSLRQVFQPFEVFSLRVAAPAEAIHEVLRVAPLPLAILAAFHSLLTLSFLALFVLALRRRLADVARSWPDGGVWQEQPLDGPGEPWLVRARGTL